MSPLAVKQPLLKNAGLTVNRANINRAELGVTRANLDYQSRLLQVVRDTENAYYNLVFAREQLKVRNSSLELAARLYEENQTRKTTGVATDLDVLQAEVGVANARRNVIDAEKTVQRPPGRSPQSDRPVRIQPDARRSQPCPRRKSRCPSSKNPSRWPATAARLSLHPRLHQATRTGCGHVEERRPAPRSISAVPSATTPRTAPPAAPWTASRRRRLRLAGGPLAQRAVGHAFRKASTASPRTTSCASRPACSSLSKASWSRSAPPCVRSRPTSRA
jgi:hypothetical protein